MQKEWAVGIQIVFHGVVGGIKAMVSTSFIFSTVRSTLLFVFSHMEASSLEYRRLIGSISIRCF